MNGIGTPILTRQSFFLSNGNIPIHQIDRNEVLLKLTHSPNVCNPQIELTNTGDVEASISFSTSTTTIQPAFAPFASQRDTTFRQTFSVLSTVSVAPGGHLSVRPSLTAAMTYLILASESGSCVKVEIASESEIKELS